MKWLFLFRSLILRPLRIWRWISMERPMRFTRFGFFYILFTIAVGAAAINTGNNLLYLILGIQLSFIIVSGILSDSVLWGLSSRWHPLNDLFVGRPAQWTVEIRKGWFPSALVKLTGDWSSDVRRSVWVPWVNSRKSAVATLELTPRERGWLYLKRVRYGTAFPFGLFEKTHGEVRSDRWLVFPRLLPIPIKGLLAPEGDGANTPASQRSGEGSVPWVVRDYRAGDSLRRMDWKTVAKRGRYIVKEMEEDTDPAPVLMVTSWPQEDGERFISFIASLLWTANEQGRALGLCTPDRYFAGGSVTDSLRRIWQYLALVDVSALSSRTQAPPTRLLIDALQLWKKHRHEFHA
jgi:uncharacterized protein (DUF58 family)